MGAVQCRGADHDATMMPAWHVFRYGSNYVSYGYSSYYLSQIPYP